MSKPAWSINPNSVEGQRLRPYFIPVDPKTSALIYKDPYIKQMFLGEPGLTEDKQLQKIA